MNQLNLNSILLFISCIITLTSFQSCDSFSKKEKPSQKEVITYDEVLKLYTCLNKENLIGDGENNFIWKHGRDSFDLRWENKDGGYNLYFKGLSNNYIKSKIVRVYYEGEENKPEGKSTPIMIKEPIPLYDGFYEYISLKLLLEEKFSCILCNNDISIYE
jgi:hypothetical protein